MSYDPDVWMKTVTVVEKDREEKPVIFTASGKPLIRERRRVGFGVPPKETKKS